MSAQVSVLVTSTGEVTLLERQLPELVRELEERGQGEQIVVVDASGEALLGSWLAERFPAVGLVACEGEETPQAALLRAAAGAEGELLLVVSAAVRPRAGLLAPLIEALLPSDVAVVTPCAVERDGRPRPFPALAFEDGRLQPAQRSPDPSQRRPWAVPFPDGAFLLRAEEFVQRGGFDPLFGPLGCGEADLGLEAWRSGRRVLAVPQAEVEVLDAALQPPEALVRAAEEKNRLLLLWKYLDTRREAHDHLALLWRDALDAAIAGRREDLLWMALALQELPRVGRSRQRLGPATRSLEQVL